MDALENQMCPFKVAKNRIMVPRKYWEAAECESVPHTNWDWGMLMAKLIGSYWLDKWYSPELPTPKTQFYTLEEFKDLNCKFNSPKFVRLNSVSPKVTSAFENSNSAYTAILNSRRCQEAIELAEGIGEQPLVAVRDFHDLKYGNEYRVFIYEDRIVAICSNDYKITTLSHTQILERISSLFEKVRWNLPCCDAVMDVWLSDTKSIDDLLIEFNSYGFWGRSSAELYDWFEDAAILYGNGDKIDIRIAQ